VPQFDGYAGGGQEPTERIANAQAEALQAPKLDQALIASDERSRNIVQSRWLAMDADGNRYRALHDLAEEYGISARARSTN
jgi:RNA polymerase sigma-32 factor